MSQRPQRCRTWAPRGQTPLLQCHFNWKMLSAIAGVTWWNFYFRLFPGTIRSPQIIEFLSPRLRHIPGQLLIVWDGLPGHRSRAVWDFVQQQRGRLWLEFLPAYALELNPVEYLRKGKKMSGKQMYKCGGSAGRACLIPASAHMVADPGLNPLRSRLIRA